MKSIAQFLWSLFTVLAGGQMAPIGYVLGIGLSFISIVILFNNPGDLFLGALVAALIGLTILFFRIKKDIKDIKES